MNASYSFSQKSIKDTLAFYCWVPILKVCIWMVFWPKPKISFFDKNCWISLPFFQKFEETHPRFLLLSPYSKSMPLETFWGQNLKKTNFGKSCWIFLTCSSRINERHPSFFLKNNFAYVFLYFFVFFNFCLDVPSICLYCPLFLLYFPLYATNAVSWKTWLRWEGKNIIPARNPNRRGNESSELWYVMLCCVMPWGICPDFLYVFRKSDLYQTAIRQPLRNVKGMLKVLLRVFEESLKGF